MTSYVSPLLYVLFVWWFSTGAVIYLNNLPSRTFAASIGIATLIAAASIAGLYGVKSIPGVAATYCSFTCGLLVWAWTQLTFYTGVLTGPRKVACADDCGGIRHFWHAFQTSMYHELAALTLSGVILWASWEGVNKTGWWTYAILWGMHTSAKLNAVFGVRNLNEEFFPEHLKYLRNFLREKPINPLFPFSVTAGTIVSVVLVQKAASAPGGSYESVSFVFLSTIMILAVVEHWLLILPIPAAALWSWGLRGRETAIAQGAEPEASAPLVPPAKLPTALHRPAVEAA